MIIQILNHSDNEGGAAKASYRIFRALHSQNIEITMHVNIKSNEDDSVLTSCHNLTKLINRLKNKIANKISRIHRTENKILHSLQIFPSSWPKYLNKSKSDIVHLNWICSEMLSINDLALINKPIVWTMHDMWPFCGAEHVAFDDRWRNGYHSYNRSASEGGFDFNRWVWNRKIKAWRKPIHIVAPSEWMADCVRQSVLMHNWPVSTIHNPIDTSRWCPMEKCTARELLGLPQNVPIIGFGALRAGEEPHKGFDLLLSALNYLREKTDNLEVVVFGNTTYKKNADIGFPVHYMGHLTDDLTLRVVYNAIDSLIIPSRVDNLPNTGVESLSCGTPIVAFDTCGLPDLVEHMRTGWLSPKFDTENMANGILWVINNPLRQGKLSINSREKALKEFSEHIVVSKYLNLYNDLLQNI